MNRKFFNLVIILLILSSAVVQAQNRIRYTAIPKEGYRFVGWMDVDARSSTANPLVISISPIPDSLEDIPLITVSNPITSRIIRLADNIFTSTQGVVKQEVLNGNTDNPLTTMNSSANIPALKAYFVESGNLQGDGNELEFIDTSCNNTLVSFIFKHVPSGSVSLLNRTFTTTYDYYISETEITQNQWKYVMGCNNNDNPSKWKSSVSLPVEQVSWYAALVFCNRLSDSLGLTRVYSINGSTDPSTWGSIPTNNSNTWNAVVCNWDANGVRLPTEIEWMNAAREGVNSSYTYSGSNTADNVAWYEQNSNKTQTVAGKAANSLGLYDMSGNVCEWCWDRYSSTLPNGGTDYRGPSSGDLRVRKGGCYNSKANYELELDRAWGIEPQTKSSENGFRVVVPNPKMN